jgi:hypothetical protein
VLEGVGGVESPTIVDIWPENMFISRRHPSLQVGFVGKLLGPIQILKKVYLFCVFPRNIFSDDGSSTPDEAAWQSVQVYLLNEVNIVHYIFVEPILR